MDQNEQFVNLLSRHHQRIFVFILSLVCNQNEADDILQETNLVLWRKFGEFEPGTDFRAWAFRVAYLKVLQHWEKKGKERVQFDEAFLHRVADLAVTTPDTVDRRREALAKCLAQLPKRKRDMIRCRYRAGGSEKAVAQELGCSAHAIHMALTRVRRALHDCVRIKLAMEDRF